MSINNGAWLGAAAAVLALALGVCSDALAQSANAPIASPTAIAPPAVVAAPTAPAPVAPMGTPVEIVVDELLSSKSSVAGQTFRLHLAQPIIVDGKQVSPAGAPGGGEVINVARSNIGGRPGELTLAVRYLDFAGQRVRINRFRYGRTGQDYTNAAIAASAAVGLVGLLITGGNIDVAPGTLGSARLAEPLLVVQPPASPSASSSVASIVATPPTSIQ